MSQKQGRGGGARKIGTNKESCKLYASQVREDRNRKRKMLRHLKKNPGDDQNLNDYTVLFGEPTGLKLVSRGRMLERRNDRERNRNPSARSRTRHGRRYVDHAPRLDAEHREAPADAATA